MNRDVVLDGIDVGILVTGPSGEITFANKAAHELASIARPESEPLGAGALIGVRVSEIIDLPRALHDLEPTKSLRFDSRVSGGEEDPVELDVTLTPLDAGWVFALRDVTEERRMHVEMQRVERLAAIGTMVAGFAHEVRNPVASLRAITEALEEELQDRGLSLPHTTRMLEVLGRIERLVRTSLEFGRPTEARRARHGPAALVRSAVNAVSVRTAGASIDVDAQPDLPAIFVDEGQFVQVLVILLNNALDASGSPSKVAVRVFVEEPLAARRDGRRVSDPPGLPAHERRGSARVRFEVVDQGPGIPASRLPRVFDAFFTTKALGTGLGLAIAQKIVTENGAHIEIASARAPTIFAVTCPPAEHEEC
ncbi:MAG: ATP-binding protein [Polyangiaceae bacterium]